MNDTPFKKPINKDLIIYIALLLLVILYRCLVLVDFGFTYTDSDQTIMWLGLKEYASGIFHEPRFYGQAYSTMLEALAAVPLYKMGVPAYKCLPIITTVFTLTPFVLFSFFTFIKKSTKIAIVIISIPLLLPVEYALVTTLPRGFVAGIFVTAIGCVACFFPKSKGWFFVLGFMGVLGFSINSNSVLLFLPCIMYVFLENIKNKYFYFYSLLGISLGFCIHTMVNYFYVVHPFYDFHKINLYYSSQTAFHSLKKLDPFLNDVTPVFWKSGFLVLLAFVFFSTLLIRKKEYRSAFSVLTIPILIFLTLGINKVHDGTLNIFFSYSRMYLAVPVLLAFSVSFFKINNGKFFYLYAIIPCAFFLYQISTLNSIIKKSVIPSEDSKVAVSTINAFSDECNHLQAICYAYKIDLVVIVNHPNCDFYNYGCPAYLDNFPKTLRPSYERRTWRFFEDENKIYKNILLVDVGRNAMSNPDILYMLPGEKGLFVIKNNTKTNIDLFNQMYIPYRVYKRI